MFGGVATSNGMRSSAGLGLGRAGKNSFHRGSFAGASECEESRSLKDNMDVANV
jgi:hypothetical protein